MTIVTIEEAMAGGDNRGRSIKHNERVDVPGVSVNTTQLSDQAFAQLLVASAPLAVYSLVMTTGVCEKRTDLDVDGLQSKLAELEVYANVLYTADVATLGLRVHFTWIKTNVGWKVLGTRYRGSITARNPF